MLKNLIKDLKLTAMDMVEDVKDLAHDITTDLPDTVQKDFKKMDNQSFQAADLGYMNGWNTMGAQMTANQIDLISDKMNFISQVIQDGLLGFDTIEEELRMLAAMPQPPQPAQLLSLAARIDATQRQAFAGLQKLRELSREIDHATDKLQGKNNRNGWGNRPNNGW